MNVFSMERIFKRSERNKNLFFGADTYCYPLMFYMVSDIRLPDCHKLVPYPFVVVCLQPTHSAKGNIRFSVSVFSSFFSMKEELPQSRRLVCVPSL